MTTYCEAESPDWEPSTVVSCLHFLHHSGPAESNDSVRFHEARKSEDEEERELVDASLPWWDVNVACHESW